MNGIDIATDTTGKAHLLAAGGIQVVIAYARPDRCSKAMMDGLAEVGIKRGLIWEKGRPDLGVGYYTKYQAEFDAVHAAAFAKSVGMPPGFGLPAAFDYDPPLAEIEGQLSEYQVDFRRIIMEEGFLAACYGSGLLGHTFVDMGIAHWFWDDQSTGHAGHFEYEKEAAIIQGRTTNLNGLDVDLDVIVNPTVAW